MGLVNIYTLKSFLSEHVESKRKEPAKIKLSRLYSLTVIGIGLLDPRLKIS
jgi:hypothetical protein